MRAALAISVLATAVACSDLSTPAELDHPQVLAIRAESPAIPEGARTRVQIWVAGPQGLIDPAGIEWSVIAPSETEPALGRIELEGTEAYYVAPDTVEGVALATVRAIVTLDDQTELVAVKGLGVGVPQPTENPVITALRADGAAIDADDPIVVPQGAVVALDFTVEPPLTEDAVVSWHATVGELDGYLSAAAELSAGEGDDVDTGEGRLFLVYRDGAGGVDVRAADLIVQ